MARVHAFTDDALADHDAVGLVAELREGRVSIPEVVEAAIARAERVDPQLNGLALRAYDQARTAAADPRGGFFAGVPTGAVRRLRRMGALSAELYREVDVVLSPTLATPTPCVGHLDPMQDYETVRDRLLEWVAFTPYQNATGEPAVSLPLGIDRDGLPLGLMFSAGTGREATLLELAYELEQARPWRRIQD